MTEGRATVHTAGAPPQKTDIQNKNGPPGIEITLITAGQTMSDLEEDTLMMTAWTHETGTEKNAEKEIEIEMEIIGKGPGNPHLLKEGAQTEE